MEKATATDAAMTLREDGACPLIDPPAAGLAVRVIL